MTVKDNIKRLRVLLSKLGDPPPPVDLSLLTSDERVTWEVLLAKLPTKCPGYPATGLEALTDEELDAYEAMLCKFAGQPPPEPRGPRRFGVYSVPPVGHPQRAEYERGELGYGLNDPNGHAHAGPVAPAGRLNGAIPSSPTSR